MNQEQLALDCMELIRKKSDREINRDQFYIELCLLDKKYPGIGFKEGAEKFIRHWEKIDKEKLPLDAWRSKRWPLSLSTWRESEANDGSELTGQMAIEFEKKRKEAQDKLPRERLPYKDQDDEVPF
jgi:hypothetical protein